MARPKKLPTVLTEDEQARLLDQPNPRYPTGECNRAMLNLMLNTGLRLAEGIAWGWVLGSAVKSRRYVVGESPIQGRVSDPP